MEIVEYLANGLLSVFTMDMDYFTEAIPITNDIFNIIIASAWALLLGNMVFQAAKSMMSGIGLEGEEPSQLFARTFLFGFLLLASRQVCEIGLGLSSAVINMLQVPDSVSVSLPGEDVFGIGASWLLMIIVGVVLMFQIVKLFFTIGERYFLVGFLTIVAPWAFAMGGSKSTSDIFKGWARMFASMCLMMVLNVVFLKMLLSAMGNMPEDAGVIPWIIFVIAICRVARKADTMVMRVGLNPVPAGDGLGRNFLGSMASYVIMKSVSSAVTKAVGGAAGKAKTASGGTPPPPTGSTSTSYSRKRRAAAGDSRTNTHSTNNQSARDTTATKQSSTNTGTAGSSTATNTPSASGAGASTPRTGNVSSQGQAGDRQYHGAHGMAGTNKPNTYRAQKAEQNAARRTSVQPGINNGTRGSEYRPGTAGSVPPQSEHTRTVHANSNTSTRERSSRYSSVPHNLRNTAGTHGTAGTAHSSRVHQGGVNVNAASHADVKNEVSNTTNENFRQAPGAGRAVPGQGNKPAAGTHGNAGSTEKRRSSIQPESPASNSSRYSRNRGISPQAERSPNSNHLSRTAAVRDSSGVKGNAASSVRDGRNSSFTPTGTNFTAARREGGPVKHDSPRKTNQPQSGTADGVSPQTGRIKSNPPAHSHDARDRTATKGGRDETRKSGRSDK